MKFNMLLNMCQDNINKQFYKWFLNKLSDTNYNMFQYKSNKYEII